MTEKVINKNMLRERALKLPKVSDEMLKQIPEEHLLLMKEYLEISSGSLSSQTVDQYRSALGQFFWWVHVALNDKSIEKISKRDFMRYLSYLSNRGMSSSGQALKKAAVSSFSNYIENVVADDDEKFKTFRNFTRGLPSIPKNVVYNKVKITKDEYDLLISTLLEDENYLGATWVATAFNIGARRSEIPQLKSEILSYPLPEGQNYIMSHMVRLKGRGEDGKQEPYMVNTDALEFMKMWIEKRGYEHSHIFTVKYGGEIRKMSPSWADDFCANVLTDILGRRINPHLFKASCITYLLEIKKVKLEIVSKYIAHHNDVSTTIKHYDLRDFEEEKNQIFG
ncbi:site-specific integrase [Paenibacillus sp. N1-5-1-14]|uniref:tyrosine-type recombinase/integrase n=1 Tax=Paenibacillus radicibacter TaxID=2972488 RepID=UPI002158C538|nr:site-specific integrase [Paenibacillus radicibacter]MCR8641548.1 site-specific integrase [Paenibacillus radicibacter]